MFANQSMMKRGFRTAGLRFENFRASGADYELQSIDDQLLTGANTSGLFHSGSMLISSASSTREPFLYGRSNETAKAELIEFQFDRTAAVVLFLDLGLYFSSVRLLDTTILSDAPIILEPGTRS